MNEKITEYLALLKAVYDIQSVHEESCKTHLLENGNDGIYLLKQFQYLIIKYNYFIFEDDLLTKLVEKNLGISNRFSFLDFEKLVQSLMYIAYDKVYLLTKGSHDSGIDLESIDYYSTGYKEIIGHGKAIVQCKFYSGYVPVNEIREFYGVLTNELSIGHFFTTGKITKMGIDFILKSNNNPINSRLHVIEKTKLTKVLKVAENLCELMLDLYEYETDDDDDDEYFNESITEINILRRNVRQLIEFVQFEQQLNLDL